MAFGEYMGWNGIEDAARLGHANTVAQTRWARFTQEIPWHLPTPDSLAGAGVLDTTVWTDIVALARTHNQRLICIATGVPRVCNSNAGSADPSADGNWHWYPNTTAGRALYAGYCVQIAGTLDPTLDVIELGNELNIHQFNHGDQPAEEIAEAVADAAAAVRAAYPTLKIMCGGVANRGDIDNIEPTDIGWTGSDFILNMVVARPDLLTLIDYWSYHPYIFSRGLADFAENDPMGTQGWGLRQMDQAYDYLLFMGVAEPKIWVTEYGEPNTGAFPYGADYAAFHAARYFQAFDTRRTQGKLDPEGAEIRHTLLQGDEGGGAIYLYFGIWEQNYSATINSAQYIERAERTPAPPTVNWVFSPPLAEYRRPTQDANPVQLLRNPAGNRLAGFFIGGQAALNVYIKADGSATSDEPSGEEWPTLRRVFYGGRVDPYEVNATEKTALEAAGFTVTAV